MRTRKKSSAELRRVTEDREWWESLLPPGYRLLGWTDRSYATVIPPQRGAPGLDVNGAFLEAVAGHHREAGARAGLSHHEEKARLLGLD